MRSRPSIGTRALNEQDIIDIINANVVASPGFTYGRSGVLNAGTYLLNDTVPSNNSGRNVPVASNLYAATLTCRDAATYSVKVQKRSGVSFVDIATISVIASRTHVEVFGTPIPLIVNDELSVVVLTSDGILRDLVVGLLLAGSTS